MDIFSHLMTSHYLKVASNYCKIEAVIQRRPWQKVFYCEYCEIFKNTFFIEHLRSLPLVKSEQSL